MKRQKRDKTERAFAKGYQTGNAGRSNEICPHQDTNEQRQAWLNGWREGWTDHVDGYVGVSGLGRGSNNGLTEYDMR